MWCNVNKIINKLHVDQITDRMNYSHLLIHLSHGLPIVTRMKSGHYSFLKLFDGVILI